jgi:hypothetical protein
LPKTLIPFAICYDFDGTLAPGNMQERDFIPKIGMTKKSFWNEVRTGCKQHDADNILIYMALMLERARIAHVQVRRHDFVNYGKSLKLFGGVDAWFQRINDYGKAGGIRVTPYHLIRNPRDDNRHFYQEIL